MKRRVFCKDCKWYTDTEGFLRKDQCRYPNNTTKEVKETWKERKVKYIYRYSPSHLNKNNDCGWFCPPI